MDASLGMDIKRKQIIIMADESTEIQAAEDGPPSGPAPRMHFPGLRHYIRVVADRAFPVPPLVISDTKRRSETDQRFDNRVEVADATHQANRASAIAERTDPVRRIVDIITNAVRSDDKKNVAETLENAKLQLQGLMIGLTACVSALTDVCDGKETVVPEWLEAVESLYVNCEVIEAHNAAMEQAFGTRGPATPVVVTLKEDTKPKSTTAEPPSPPVEPIVEQPPATGEAPPVEPPMAPTPPPAKPGPAKKDK